MDSRAAFLRSSVVHRWRYVTPAHLAVKIRRMHRTCVASRYLDCVLEHAEVCALSRQFSELHGMPDLADPETFLNHFDTVRRKKRV